MTPSTHQIGDNCDKKVSARDKDSLEKLGEVNIIGMNQRGAKKINREVLISKALSKLLRHAADDVGLELDKNAYARVDQILEWQRLKSLKVTFADIQRIVQNDVKKRFAMRLNPTISESPDPESSEPSDWVIRANQGHSIKVDSAKLLAPITDEIGNVPDIVVHGTYYYFFPSIIESGGLNRMTRTHIHFTKEIPSDGQKNLIGMRNDVELLIIVDVRASLRDGILWWLSDNGVVLTAGDSKGYLPVKYFKKVIGRKDNIGVLLENGVEIRKLPESDKYMKPLGKKHKACTKKRQDELVKN